MRPETGAINKRRAPVITREDSPAAASFRLQILDPAQKAAAKRGKAVAQAGKGRPVSPAKTWKGFVMIREPARPKPMAIKR